MVSDGPTAVTETPSEQFAKKTSEYAFGTWAERHHPNTTFCRRQTRWPDVVGSL